MRWNPALVRRESLTLDEVLDDEVLGLGGRQSLDPGASLLRQIAHRDSQGPGDAA